MWATAGPRSFDCSGFTHWVASQVLGPQDYELRSSHHQFNVWGEPVEGEGARAGDLLFFDTTGDVVMGNRASHVGLYLGDGRMIHAANPAQGVIISDPWSDWYGERFIGARRIFDLGEAPQITSQNGKSDENITEIITTLDAGKPHKAPRLRVMLGKQVGEISTPNQWNGEAFPVTWEVVNPWLPELSAAARESGVDVRVIAAVAMMETQLIHYRDGGHHGENVVTVWDDFPQDGPSVGITQVKPDVWGWLRPDLNPYLPGQNLRLGAAVIAHLLEQTGGDLDAAMRKWFPAKAPNGTIPDSYMQTFWGLLGELGYGA